MNGSKSKKNIIAEFYHSDGKITVISFDGDGRRKMTYSGLNIFSAMTEIAKQTSRGFDVRVFASMPSVGFGLEWEKEAYDGEKYRPFCYQS